MKSLSFPHSLGYPDSSRSNSCCWNVLPSSLTTLASKQRPLGGSVRHIETSQTLNFTNFNTSLHTLANLHGGGDVNNAKVLAEYQEIEEALRFEREHAVTSFKALTEKRMFKRVILGM
jgi:hypothetical protein